MNAHPVSLMVGLVLILAPTASADEPRPSRLPHTRLQRAFNLMNEGDLAVERKDHEAALRAYGGAEALVPDSAEMTYWHAVALVNMRRVDESLPLFKRAFAKEPGWRTLTPRLVGVGLLPDDKPALEAILKQGVIEAKETRKGESP